jgi:Reverse transcriptase (RNA-dependent DNA polymerase)
VLQCFASFLPGRRQCVRFGGRQSKCGSVDYGVPQGSVLGPLLFIDTADIGSMATARRLHSHQYADDIQFYGWRLRTESHVLRDQLSNCVEDICSWMCSHRLQLNTSKTEFVFCCTSRRRQHLPDSDFLDGAKQVQLIPSARYLGVYVDGEMSLRSNISHVAALCFSALRQIRSIRRSLSSFALMALVTSLFHSRLDYGNFVFAGLPSCDLRRLHTIWKALVRLAASARKYDRVTPLLCDRHWLPIAERVEYKLCTPLTSFDQLRLLVGDLAYGSLTRCLLTFREHAHYLVIEP